ncbi:hypothetical protein ACRC6Q_07845 [Planococcus sp. SE5232]|uniref:hypothetical protein n=1 Tax=unclassified Planococcus (in: firmicutes) TaxID=2662419 RepID=UPI003D6B1E75
MYKLLMLLYWLCAILTLAAFYGMNALSVETKDAFDNPEVFSLFTIFSNHIFFNPLTFILVVMACFLAGLVWSLIRNRPKNK